MTRRYTEVAGQLFWEELTGDAEFYTKMIKLMQDIPKKHMEKYKPKHDASLNKRQNFQRSFVKLTALTEKLVKFVSGNKQVKIRNTNK